MTDVTWEHHLCDLRELEKIPKGLDAVANGVIGGVRRRYARGAIRKDAAEVDDRAPEFASLATPQLRERLADLRDHFRRHPQHADGRLVEALAALREATVRTLGIRPYTVQIMGALALRRGFLAEMATGEGKSLTAVLAAILAGWSGKPCHVITVNDYLAERDPKRMQELFEFCHVRAGYVTGPMEPHDRARGHAADITYTTSKEVVADFLRDRLRLGPRQRAAQWTVRLLGDPEDSVRQSVVMRGLHTAIIDEADSVLIDEAVTPLIIAGNSGRDESKRAFEKVWRFVEGLEPGADYRRDERHREIELLPKGTSRLEALAERMPGPWRAVARCRELVRQALVAREYYHRDRQYVVQDGEVVIVDEFTGRLALKRKWRHGLHQAIEAKEGVEISALDETLARLSFQRFYRLFRRLSGMTGTGREAAAEFWQIYRLPVLEIPTNRPKQRKDLPDRIFPTPDEKWAAVVDEVIRVHKSGRPVLVGTRSVAASEMLAEKLRTLGMECSVLNATREREEAMIVEEAGQRGRITISTNMAGRGTDILLGPGVEELGGLHVIATERHESGRVDRQLAGRAGRQGDAGSSQAFISAEDDLFRRFIPQVIRKRMHRSTHLATAACKLAQRSAEKLSFHQRRSVLEHDTWLDEALAFSGSSST
jgi:preprotein translocase subunit SecA